MSVSRLILSALLTMSLPAVVVHAQGDPQKPARVPSPVTQEPALRGGGILLQDRDTGVLRVVQPQQGPSQEIRDYIEALRALPPGERYMLGVSLKQIPEGLHHHLKLDDGAGLLIVDVAEDRPAGKAGVQKNDLLLKIDGQPIREVADVLKAVNDAAGKAVTLTLRRENEPFELSVTPVQVPADAFPGIDDDSALDFGEMQIVGPGILLNRQDNSTQLDDVKQAIREIEAQQKNLQQLVEQLSKDLDKEVEALHDHLQKLEKPE